MGAVDTVPWAEPWLRVEAEQAVTLAAELQRELARGHVLEGRRWIAVGRRQDDDDVLFAIEGAGFTYAVVHLTWRASREHDAASPATTAFASLDDWLRQRFEPDIAQWRELGQSARGDRRSAG